MSKYAHLSDDEALALFKSKRPFYQRTLSKLNSLLRTFLGRVFSAFAASTYDVGGGAETLELSGFKVPPKAKLAGYLDAIATQDDLNDLSELCDRLASSKLPAMKEQAKAAKKLYNALFSAYQEALDALEEMTQKHLPDAVGKIFKVAQSVIESKSEDAYTSHTAIVGVKDDVVDFVQASDVSMWERSDKSESMLNVVITVRLRPTENSYTTTVYVTTLDRMPIPFKYELGTSIGSGDARKLKKDLDEAIQHEMAHNDVSAVLGNVDLTVDDVEIRAILEDLPGIVDFSVFDDSIQVEFDSDDRSNIGNVVRALNNYRKIKELIRKNHTPSLRELGPNLYEYTVSYRKG